MFLQTNKIFLGLFYEEIILMDFVHLFIVSASAKDNFLVCG